MPLSPDKQPEKPSSAMRQPHPKVRPAALRPPWLGVVYFVVSIVAFGSTYFGLTLNPEVSPDLRRWDFRDDQVGYTTYVYTPLGIALVSTLGTALVIFLLDWTIVTVRRGKNLETVLQAEKPCSFREWYGQTLAHYSQAIQVIAWVLYGFLWIPLLYWLLNTPEGAVTAVGFRTWYNQRFGQYPLGVQGFFWLFSGYIWIPLMYYRAKKAQAAAGG